MATPKKKTDEVYEKFADDGQAQELYEQGWELLGAVMEKDDSMLFGELTEAQFNKIKKAGDLFADVLLRAPDAGPAMYALALCYRAAGHNEEAHELLEQAAAHESKEVEIVSQLGIQAIECEKKAKAIEYCKDAVRLDPKDTGVRMNLVIAHLLYGKVEDAVREAKKVAKEDPKDDMAQAVAELCQQVASRKMKRPKNPGEYEDAIYELLNG